MKILFVNVVGGTGSTGRICADLAEHMERSGAQCRIAYGRPGTVPAGMETVTMQIGGKADFLLHAAASRVTDRQGFYSKKATRNWLQEVQAFDPDLIHLHNLHGYYLNLPELFSYLKESRKPVIWTLHDSWAYTGHCAYYDFAGCGRWKTGCCRCPEKRAYPESLLFDQSEKNYAQKKELFLGLPDLTITTPSRWLEREVKQSFLGEYPVLTIPNGIDLEQFTPTLSDLRAKYDLLDKKIVLGVASIWDRRKGLETFCSLAGQLGEGYQIVLVGLSREQISMLPDGILGLPRTNSVKELAQWYTAADVYLNASREETMGLTTVEAAACGTPVVVLDATALPEVARELGGYIVPLGDADALQEAVKAACSQCHGVDAGRLDGFRKNQMTSRFETLYRTVFNRR